MGAALFATEFHAKRAGTSLPSQKRSALPWDQWISSSETLPSARSTICRMTRPRCSMETGSPALLSREDAGGTDGFFQVVRLIEAIFGRFTDEAISVRVPVSLLSPEPGPS